jgi:hypothetical protein
MNTQKNQLYMLASKLSFSYIQMNKLTADAGIALFPDKRLAADLFTPPCSAACNHPTKHELPQIAKHHILFA